MQIDGRAAGEAAAVGSTPVTSQLLKWPDAPRGPVTPGLSDEVDMNRDELGKRVSADHVRPVGGEVFDINICGNDFEEAMHRVNSKSVNETFQCR